MFDVRKEPRSYLLLLIIGVAAIFRAFHIDQPFVDFVSWRESDDATIADNFFRGNQNVFLPEISWNGPGPNYVGYEFQLTTYLASLLYRILGQHDWVGRGVAVAFGLWGIFAFYKLVCCVFDKRQALISCAVLAILPCAIFVDRSFLPDPVMVSLVVTSFWLLLIFLQKADLRFLYLSIAIGICGLLTKLSGMIVGLPIAYAVVHLRPKQGNEQRRYFAILACASIVILATVLSYYAWAIHVSKTYPPYHVAASGNWVWDSSFETWLRVSYFIPKLRFQAKWLWGIPLLGLACLGLFAAPARHAKLPWLFHFWLLAGVCFYGFGAQELVDNPWNFHIIDPVLAALAAQGLLLLWRVFSRLRLRPTSRIVLLLLIVASHAVALRKLRLVYTPYAHEDQQLGLALAQIGKPDDLVATIGTEIGDPTAIYYSHRRGWIFPPAWPGVNWWEDIADERSAIEAFDKLQSLGAQWIGVVATQNEKLRKNTPKLWEHIEGNTELAKSDAGWTIYRILSKAPKV
jgi:hypothetical protein